MPFNVCKRIAIFLSLLLIASFLTSCKALGTKPVSVGETLAAVNQNGGAPIEKAAVDNYELRKYHYGLVAIEKEENGIGGYVSAVQKNAKEWYDFEVNFDSLGEHPEKRVAAIYSGMPNMNEDSLEFKPVKKALAAYLRNSGYEVTSDPEKATVFIAVSFGISEPNVDYRQVNVPLFGYDGGTTSTTHFNAYGNSNISGSATTYSTGQGLYLQGYASKTEKIVTYKRLMILRALDAEAYRKEGKEKEVWIFNVDSVGSSDDLRLIMPAMLSAAADSIGTHQHHKKSIRLNNRDMGYLKAKFLLSPDYKPL